MRARRVAVSAAAGLLVIAGAGCVSVEGSVNGETSSPWVWGPGVRVLSQRALGAPGTTLNPMGVYNLYFQDGGSVHRFEVGAQIRRYSGRTDNPLAGLWYGGEAAVGYLHDRFEGGTSNHFGGSFGPVIGIPVGQGARPVHVIAGAGLSHYGSTGKNVRLGVEWTR